MVGCSDSTAPQAPTRYIVTADQTSGVVGDVILVKAQLVDAKDRSVPLQGKVVSWSVTGSGFFLNDQTLTDANGLATNHFVPTKAATNEIAVVDENHLRGVFSSIDIGPGAPFGYAVRPSSSTPAIGATISLTAQLVDKYGNPSPIGGRVVTWYVDGNGEFASPASTTDSYGLATVNFHVGTDASRWYNFLAKDDQGIYGISEFEAQPGPVAKFLVKIPVSDPPAGAPIIVTAYPQDSYSNPILSAIEGVTWSVTGAGGSLSSTVTSTLAGYTTTVLTTGLTPGTSYTVSASVVGATGASPTITTLEQMSLASMSAGFGSESSCGLSSDGKAWCWGAGRPVPGKPAADQIMSALSTAGRNAAGASFATHTCGVSAGVVMCWGANDSAQLGDGSRISRDTPRPIDSPLAFTAVSAGPEHTCAVATTADIYCWGSPKDGRLGDDNASSGLTPVKVGGALSFTRCQCGPCPHLCHRDIRRRVLLGRERTGTAGQRIILRIVNSSACIGRSQLHSNQRRRFAYVRHYILRRVLLGG
jgi:hypothetical protein